MQANKIIRGVKWASIELFFNAIFKFLVKLLLARLLLPEDFGLVGMTTVFIAVISAASELGMAAALIQKKEDQHAEKLYDTAFWTGISIGVVLFILMSFVVGPFAAYFFNEPILVKLMPVLSIGILVKPINVVHYAILTRAMDFRKLAMVNNLAAFVAGAIALASAYWGLGVWSLAINNFLAVGLTVPLLFLITKWVPKSRWNKAHFKEIFGFGIYSTGTSVFGTLTYNIDHFLIGRILGSASLGSYTLSFTLTEQLRQTISGILNRVMYPVFGKNQDDKIRLKYYFLKIVKLNAIVIYPIMGLFIFFPMEIITTFFGDRWIESVEVLRILAISMMVHLVVNSFTSLLRGMGYPNIEFKIIVILTLTVLIPGLYMGIKYFGLIGASYAILLNKVVLVITAIIILKYHINVTVLEIIQSLAKTIISLGIASSIVILLMNLIGDYSFWIQAPVFLIVYLISVFSLEKNEITSIVRQILK